MQHLRTQLWLLILTACRLSTAGQEVLLPPDDSGIETPAANDAGSSATATGSSPATATPSAVDASAGSSSAAAPASDASVPPAPAPDAGSMTSTPTAARAPDADAGAPPAGNDDAQQAADDLTCAFEFAGCLLLDPLNYAECARMNADHCDLLAARGPAADGGTGPSPACALQTADCIAKRPELVLDCIAMQDQCTL